jgi:signal peptidase I
MRLTGCGAKGDRSPVGALLRGLFKVVLWTAAIALTASAVLNLFFVDVVQVTHNAMAPTLVAGEQALVWRRSDPAMGRVMVCEHPGHPGQLIIGRVVGKRGMRIEAPRGTLTVAGTHQDTDITGTMRFYDALQDRTDTMRFGMAKLGNTEHRFFQREDHTLRIDPLEVRSGLYLLGDNRSHPHNDSRTFGEVDPESCRGRVFMRLRPNPDDPNDMGHGWFDWVK